jgi:hypothetical protein
VRITFTSTLSAAAISVLVIRLRDGSAYVKAGADTVWAPILDITADPTNDGRDHTEDEQLAIESDADRVLIEANNRLAAKARQAPTMRQRLELLFEAGHLPDGNEIFDLVLEDQVAHYAWVRCIDWVLWRLAHGKPVKTLADPDHESAAIDARYDAARVLSSNIESYRTAVIDADIHLLCAGELIERMSCPVSLRFVFLLGIIRHPRGAPLSSSGAALLCALLSAKLTLQRHQRPSALTPFLRYAVRAWCGMAAAAVGV